MLDYNMVLSSWISFVRIGVELKQSISFLPGNAQGWAAAAVFIAKQAMIRYNSSHTLLVHQD